MFKFCCLRSDFLQFCGRERVHPQDLDTKLLGSIDPVESTTHDVARPFYAFMRHHAAAAILTFGELEALAGFGLTGFLAFYGAGVAGHEAFGTKSALVFGIDFHEGAGDSQTECLGLSFVTAAVEIYVDIIFFSHVECRQRLFYDILED